MSRRSGSFIGIVSVILLFSISTSSNFRESICPNEAMLEKNMNNNDV